MKKLSFKIITTVWITLLIAVVCGVSTTALILMSRETADEKLRQSLVAAVESNSDEMEYSNGIFEVENDFSYYSNGIYCDLFSENGGYIGGETPQSLVKAPEAVSAQVIETELDGGKYYVFSKLLSFTKFEYEIDVLSGRVISYEADVTPANELKSVPYSETSFKNGINTSKAVEIALSHAGVNPAETTVIGVQLPAHNDRQVFKIEFVSENSPYEKVYIRAICPADDAVSAFDSVAKNALFILPLFIIAVAAGAYIISKKTVSPVEKITQAAHEISSGSDLSRRLDSSNAPLEIHTLAQTFNEMFERLQRSFETEKQFTSDASHELRTPLAVIKAECEFALSENADDKDRAEAIDSIHEQADKMAALVASLLDVTRAEQGLKRFALEKGSLGALAASVCGEFKPTKNIKLITDIEENIEINMNFSLLSRLLQNLLENADKYGREGGVINVKVYSENETAVLSVRDNGIGIAEKDLPKIWDRFFRADASRSATEGFGLGLALVGKIAEIHSAQCVADSEIDKFTEISVIFKKI